MINEKIQQGDVLIQCTMLLKMHDKNRQFQYLVQFGLGKHQQNHEEESDSWFHRVKIGKAGGMEEGRKEEGPSFPPSSIPPSSMLLTDPYAYKYPAALVGGIHIGWIKAECVRIFGCGNYLSASTAHHLFIKRVMSPGNQEWITLIRREIQQVLTPPKNSTPDFHFLVTCRCWSVHTGDSGFLGSRSDTSGNSIGP